MVSRWETRWDRTYHLQDAEKFIREQLSLASDYQPITLPYADEMFGNNPDPSNHRFIPEAEPLTQIVIYGKLRP